MLKVVALLAAALGYTVRFLLVLIRYAITAAGPVLIVYGAWLAWKPLAFVAAGGAFILLDRRVS
jgi:hypothetical protein